MSKVLNLIKKVGKIYKEGLSEYYLPLIDSKVNPFFI